MDTIVLVSAIFVVLHKDKVKQLTRLEKTVTYSHETDSLLLGLGWAGYFFWPDIRMISNAEYLVSGRISGQHRISGQKPGYTT